LALPDIYQPPIPPFLHQVEALDAGWRREGYGYLLEMGLGKTRVCIDDFCLNYLSGRVDALVVVTLKSVYGNWTRVDDENPGELQKWMWPSIAEKSFTYHYRAGRTSKDAAPRRMVLSKLGDGPKILVMNIEALSSTSEAQQFLMLFLKAHKCMFVIDESTIIKSPKALRTKTCLRLSRLAVLRRILTGSPTSGSLSDVWAQFEFLEPGLLGFSTFRAFQARYCVLREITGGNGRTITIEVGPKNIEELRDSLKLHSTRRRKKDCLDLPPKMFEKVEVELTEDQLRAYSEMKRHAMTEFEGAEVTTQIVVTQLMRMHQIVCGHITTDDGRGEECRYLVQLPAGRCGCSLNASQAVSGRYNRRVAWWYE
jgi:SNF2 family DNA or RNA helicase